MTRDSWKMFNQIASTYDRINRILSFGMDRSWRKSILRFLPKGNSLSLLDLATGTGDQLFALMDPKIDAAHGMDLAEEMLAHAKRKSEISPYREKISWSVGDASAIDQPSQSFDLVTISFGIRNVEDPQKALREMLRILKPGGRAFVLEFSLPPIPFRPLYLFYLRHILPRLGGLLSKSPSSYRYLNTTIEAFPSGRSFCHWMEKAGFSDVKSHAMALGAVTLYYGDKR